ncbi:MAG: HAD family hydrolase [Bacteroidia bacterium]
MLPSDLKMVIFDLDGTLYSLSRLRSLVVRDLLLYYMWRPHRWRELQYIRRFRSLREALGDQTHSNLADYQYEITAQDTGGKKEQIKKTIEEWMIRRPIKHLRTLQYEEVNPIFEQLRTADIKIAIFSDFPADEKLAGMGLKADYVLDATHPAVDQLKPHPRGLQYLMEQSGFAAEQCLFVGDRDDRDGEAARRAAMPYWVLPAGERPLEALLEALKQAFPNNKW